MKPAGLQAALPGRPTWLALLRAVALLAVVVAALALPTSAGAHAQLEGTVPTRGATVRAQPQAVVFRFSEPVEGSFGAVRVFDARGKRVEQGDAFHPGGKGEQLGVRLRPGLPQGTYTATYRVVSADSHPVAGGFVFSIGHAGALPRENVAQLAGRAGGGPVTDAAFGVARAVQFGAIGLALGALVFLLAVWLPALRLTASPAPEWRGAASVFARRQRRWLVGLAGAGAVSAALGVVLQGATAGGTSAWEALDPSVVRAVLVTRFGTVWGLAVLAWILVGAAAPAFPMAKLGAAEAATAFPAAKLDAAEATATLPAAKLGDAGDGVHRPHPVLLAAAGVPLAALAFLPALGGHASVQSPVALLLPANVLHVAAMGAWFGGLALLLVALPGATRALGASGDRTRLLAGVLARFSPLALGAVGVLLATGVAQALVEVRTPAHLLDTAYGRAVLLKMLLLVALIALGAYQRQRSVPRLAQAAAGGAAPGRAGVLVRRALRAEVALIVVVLGVTGALASYPPSTAATSGPFSRTVELGARELQVTVDPARVGPNEIHLYVLDARSGAPFDGAREVTVSATQPAKAIGPLAERVDRAGPGHYVVQGAALGVAGDWRIAIAVRTSDFDERETTVTVPVR